MDNFENLNYWELRTILSKTIPRISQLYSNPEKVSAVKEKGRKTGYQQFNLNEKKFIKQERLLNTEEVSSFLEISIRAAACPMPFNIDIWDGLLCIGKDQKVLTIRGWVKIQNIKKGELVVSYNEKKDIYEFKKVTQTSNTIKNNLVELELDTGEVLKLTDDHPVFTQRGWVQVKDLTENDDIKTKGIKENKSKIKRTTPIPGNHPVFDITIEDNENFIAEGILVHNCPFGCKYCFADAFRASLYTAFFDNSKTMGVRHCKPDYYKKELDKLMVLRGTDPHSISKDIGKAIALDIPVRMGIRFEDFIVHEAKKGISLAMIQYLSDINYPLMINTKSDLPGKDRYVKALSENEAGTAIHFTLITCDEDFLKKIEPGAPSFAKRLQAAKNLVQAGVRVVARIEPFLVFLTDSPDMLKEYMEKTWDAGIRNITFDTYSYSANNPGIRASFRKEGFDFDRFFLLGCDSQAIGSLLLEKFMALFQEYGFSCSTFDLGCAAANDQTICCEVGDWFKGGFNYGSSVGASRYIKDQKGKHVTWQNFEDYVNKQGGFLSEKLRLEVKGLWNLEGNSAYFINWTQGIEPYGRDEDGMIWKYDSTDFRKDILKGLIQ